MLTRNYGVTFGIVRMVWCALVFVGACASICSALDNMGFMDYVQRGKLTWTKKNHHHPKWEQMLNMVNLKSHKNHALYGVQSVKAAEEQDGTHYAIRFWSINEKQEMPTCNVEFFIPLFGRHRDMKIKSYTCDQRTLNQDAISNLTHVNLGGSDDLLTLGSLG